MPKISELPVLAEAAADDIVALVDTSGSVTSKVTRSGLVTGGFPLIATAGTDSAFTLALPTSLTNAAGQTYRVRFHLAPDAGATIAIDGQTALALRLYDGAGALTALGVGDVAIDSVVEVTLIDDGGTLRAVVNRDRSVIQPYQLNATGDAPLYGARAWVNFNGAGVVAIRASGNVSSITDNGAGDYTINFTTDMPDTNYALAGWVRADGAGDDVAYTVSARTADSKAVGSVQIRTRFRAAGSGGVFDSPEVGLVVFR